MQSETRPVRKAPPGMSPLDPALPKIDPEALKAKNYPVPDIYALDPGSFMNFSPVRPHISVANGQAMTSRVHAGEPIPALAAYQKMNKKSKFDFL